MGKNGLVTKLISFIASSVLNLDSVIYLLLLLRGLSVAYQEKKRLIII